MGEARGLSALADPLRDPAATLRAATEGESDRVWVPLRAEPGIGETVFRGYAAVVAVIIHERIMSLRQAGQGLDELTDTTLMEEVLSFPGSTTMRVPWLGRIPRAGGESETRHRCRATENMICTLLSGDECLDEPPVTGPVRRMPPIRFPHYGSMDRMMRCAQAAERLISVRGFSALAMSGFDDGMRPWPNGMFTDLRAVSCALFAGMPASPASALIASATGGWWSRSLEQAVDGLGGVDSAKRLGMLGRFEHDRPGLQVCGDLDGIGAVAAHAIRLRTRWEGRPPSRAETVDAMAADSLNARWPPQGDPHRQPLNIPAGYALKPARLRFLARRMTIRATVNLLLDEAWRSFYNTELARCCKPGASCDLSTLYGARRSDVRLVGSRPWDRYPVSRTIPASRVPDVLRDAIEGMLCDCMPLQFTAETFYQQAGGRGVWQAATWDRVETRP